MTVSQNNHSQSVETGVREVLRHTLQLGERANAFNGSTPLLGHLAELDSMAVASVLAGLEEHFDLLIDDEDISADDFATFGTLCQFIHDRHT